MISMQQNMKQYFYQEGVNVLNYLRQFFPSLEYKRLRILKGDHSALGSFSPYDRDIVLYEEVFDELMENCKPQDIAAQFIITLCHEAGHASDEFLKIPTLVESGKLPGNYTSGHAQVEAFAVYRATEMLKRLVEYPGTMFGFLWTLSELHNMAIYSISKGFEVAVDTESELVQMRTDDRYPLSQAFAKTFKEHLLHSENYVNDFEKSIEEFAHVETGEKLDLMRQNVKS